MYFLKLKMLQSQNVLSAPIELKIKVAPRDELRGYLECVPLAGIEPATCNIVGVLLYPLSYSGTQAGT